MNKNNKATIMTRVMIAGGYKDFFLGYQVVPERFDTKSGILDGRLSGITISCGKRASLLPRQC